MHRYLPKMYQKDVFHIDYQKLKAMHIKLLIFDLDNTLALLEEEKPSEKLKKLIDHLKKDFVVVIISNSYQKRVEPFAQALEVDFYAFALKPLTKSVRKIQKKYKLANRSIVMIGDQFMSDMALGNKLGLYTILVDPLGQKDLKITSINRFFEKKIMRKYQKEKLFQKGKYYG